MNLIKINLETYLPALVSLADEPGFPWEKIDELFLKKLAKRTAESKGRPMEVEASVYDLIISVKRGEIRALSLLHFIQRLAEELLIHLTPAEKPLIAKNVEQMLLSFDSKYLDFLGELAVLNNLLKAANYRLLAVERPLGNRKFIDFALQHTETGRHVLVEVVSIHLNEERVSTDAEAIRKFLTNRLANKMATKTAGLAEKPDFHLIPVVWGSVQAVQAYSDFFKTHALELPNVQEPVALLTYHNGASYYECRFGSLSTLFKH